MCGRLTGIIEPHSRIDQLMDQPRSDDAGFELRSLLVEKYEDEKSPIAAPDPVEVIRFRVEQG